MRKTICFLLFLAVLSISAKEKMPVLKVGYAGHDHQSALYVACLEAEKTKKDCGVYLKEVNPKKHYEMYKGTKKIADVEIFKAGGGSKIPTMMSQGHFEVGFGGVAAFAFFVDKGSPLKIVSPLHTKGDMLVVPPDSKVDSWKSFAAWVKEQKEPVKVGFKKPVAVAKLIFESALKAEGISYTGDASKKDVKVLMVNMKGQQNLNPGLKNGTINAYVANNPSCAIAESKGLGKVVADLNDLPPGIWKDHPCCGIAANTKALKEKPGLVKELLKLIILATNYMNEQQDEIAVKDASKWLGTSIAVEKASIPTSGYTTVPSDDWKKKMYVWVNTMQGMGKLKGGLKGKKDAAVDPLLFDFGLLEKAAKELKANGVAKRY